jgi:hypothetical protein
MLGTWLRNRRLRAAARDYARRLPPALRKDYGASETYTWQQIRASATREKLPLDYIAFGYAAFMDEAAFAALHAPAFPLTYQDMRAMLQSYAERRATSGQFEPPPQSIRDG